MTPGGNAWKSLVSRGEMERDCIIAHGMSRFLKERLYDVSDPFSFPVCRDCGFVANTSECSVCRSDDINEVVIPYSAKLLVQLLNAMAIKTKINI